MYDHKNIDKKWQDKWAEFKIFEAQDKSKKPKFYCLVEFPYPSGAGLHVGHPRSYTALDVIARKRRMEGFNVLYPIGWDAFGLPTENFAIKTGRKPQEVTAENIATFKRQLQSLGFSFDWSREINTTDPGYYKWTQWMFLQFFKNDMAYKKKMTINWCVDCKIGLANEEVVNGACERCGGTVEKREKDQWMIAITKYADRLLEDLKEVDYLDKIKKQQEDWIGKSEGAEVEFEVQGHGPLTVFTTRPDTLFGATYMVLAPEHPLVSEITTDEHRDEVEIYVDAAKKKTDIDRVDATKEKTGVFTGSYAVNPVNKEKIPIWVADYVMMNYGTGAIMAVPGHDPRDWQFAKTYDLLIRQVVLTGGSVAGSMNEDGEGVIQAFEDEWNEHYAESGKAINSGEFDGLSTAEFREKITKWLEKKGVGKAATNYKLRDWVFSRQRYWGEPIPLVECETCGWVALPEEDLPLELPEVDKYEPTDTGESPLAAIDEWVNTKCPQCGGDAKRETDTMPNWAGSSWYFLRYIDPHNNEAFADREKLKHWMPVDWYNGGMEHTTLHLLYSRFWNKFLADHGFVPVSEPYAKRTSHGLILAEDGSKMSKSKGNVVNPDEIVEKFGADSLRVYELFMGPFGEPVPWSTNGLKGVRKFLDRVMRLEDQIVEQESDVVTRSLHQTIRKVGEDIEAMRFNTAVSAMMMFVNDVHTEDGVTKSSLLTFLQILVPFAPHVANELHERIGDTGFLEARPWPKFDSTLAESPEITIAIQVDGKLRGTITVSAGEKEKEIVELAKQEENVAKYLTGEPKKTIYVEGKLVSFVV